jgi:hypothetical protein
MTALRSPAGPPHGVIPRRPISVGGPEIGRVFRVMRAAQALLGVKACPSLASGTSWCICMRIRPSRHASGSMGSFCAPTASRALAPRRWGMSRRLWSMRAVRTSWCFVFRAREAYALYRPRRRRCPCAGCWSRCPPMSATKRGPKARALGRDLSSGTQGPRPTPQGPQRAARRTGAEPLLRRAAGPGPD